jgi:hypothetical protein
MALKRDSAKQAAPATLAAGRPRRVVHLALTMPPRKRKAAAPAGVDEVDAAVEEVAPAAAVDDELPRHASEGGTTAGPGDAPAPVVETEEAAAGGDAPCVGELRGEEASVPEVDALEGEDAQALAQAGGEDGRGVTAGEAPHAAPVASSVRASPACALTRNPACLPPPLFAPTRAHKPCSSPLPPAAVHSLTRPPVCVRLLGCAQAPQEWELAPQVPAECTLSPAFRLSQLPDGTNVEEVRVQTLPWKEPCMREHSPGQRLQGVSRCCCFPSTPCPHSSARPSNNGCRQAAWRAGGALTSWRPVWTLPGRMPRLACASTQTIPMSAFVFTP